jgi:hypothetical protein
MENYYFSHPQLTAAADFVFACRLTGETATDNIRAENVSFPFISFLAVQT